MSEGGAHRAAPAMSPDRQRHRARWLVVLGIVITVLGLVGLVLSEPTSASDPNPLRVGAVSAAVGGLCVIVGALLSRDAPLAKQPPSRPTGVAWLLFAAAGCGLLALIGAIGTGSDEPNDYLLAAMLTVYPLVIYAHQWWHYRRFLRAESRATAPHGDE